MKGAATAVAVGLTLFQLTTAGFIPTGLFTQRGIHLGLVQVLAFLLFPLPGRADKGWKGIRSRVIDGILMAGSIVAPLYLIGNLDTLVNRAGAWSGWDLAVAAVGIVTLLEASRRVLGRGITLIGWGAVAFAYFGPSLPGLLQHGGYSTDRILGQLYLGQEGIFGIPLGVAATFVFIFILFGALLEATGAGRFFIDLAYSVTGRRRGGPAKAAVLASATLGSISGSAIGNVVTSGIFTIPLMKQVGYTPEEAGGIEAAASTGGQVLPPIMGAGAFLIAEYTGLPYLEVVRASIIPALLYLTTVYILVHMTAVRRGLEGLSPAGLPDLRKTLAGGWHYLIAVAVLVRALFLDLSVARVGFLACVTIALLAALRGLWAAVRAREVRVTLLREALRRGVLACALAGRNTLVVSLACAVAGVIVGVVGLTGIGLKFSGLMLSLSGGSLPLALLFLILTSLVLGMGLPVTASYVVLIVLAGPVLIGEFGLPVLVAHLLVFWYSQDSNVTPPVCLAAFAAAGIAGSDPMRTGFQAWKYAKGLYLIPLLMVVHPEIALGGGVGVVALKAGIALAALVAGAAALEGVLVQRIGWGVRALLGLTCLAAFHPELPIALLSPAGLGVFLILGHREM